MMPTRQAVILVGGKGTRLGSLTQNTPKPLMALDGDTVFLDEVIFDIARHGFNDIILAAGHFGQQIVDRFDGATIRGAGIRVVVEREPAGTGGALREVDALLAPTFLLANGDTAFDINLRRLDSLLASDSKALGCMALRHVEDVSRFGSVHLEGHHVRSFMEKSAKSGGGYINGGISLFRREILSWIDRTPCSIESDVYPRLAAGGLLLGRPSDGYFLDIGLPETLAEARRDLPWRRHRPCVFFDRDGVINKDLGYTWRVEDLEFMPGAIDAIRIVNDMGALAIVVTNQAGVGRGYYGEADVDRFHGAMQEALARQGAHLDAIYMCPFHEEAVLDEYRHSDHPDRKPNPGMILRAMEQWPVDPNASLIVGDKRSDLEAGTRAGIPAVLYEGGNVADLLAPHLAELQARSAAQRLADSGEVQ